MEEAKKMAKEATNRLALEVKNMKTKENLWEQEKEHLNSELKYAEEMAIDAKIQYADVATDKDIYENRCKTLKNEI